MPKPRSHMPRDLMVTTKGVGRLHQRWPEQLARGEEGQLALAPNLRSAEGPSARTGFSPLDIADGMCYQCLMLYQAPSPATLATEDTARQRGVHEVFDGAARDRGLRMTGQAELLKLASCGKVHGCGRGCGRKERGARREARGCGRGTIYIYRENYRDTSNLQPD
ncbi:unnamed protein product [Durusdinium trenchii]|uniref:Uncharacterized protein n=1 Tax=Durusdinium trenchii TaxID=1381693 RepID=A0ABP0S2E2_9DINO